MIRVTVVWATAAVQDQVGVELPQGATVRDAVAQSRLLAHYASEREPIGYAIYGRAVKAGEPLRDGDRVELTRPLVADPKHARARRAASSVSRRRTSKERAG